MNIHQHRPSAEPPLPPSGHGTVVLDIGDDVGALIVHTTETLRGAQIELAHHGQSQPFVHTDVRERQLPEGSTYAGVFPALTIGTYTLLSPNGTPARDITITSGHVTEITL